MLSHLKLFEERSSQKGETMGMEIYTLSCCAKPHSVNLIIQNVPLLMKKNHHRKEPERVNHKTIDPVKFRLKNRF